MSTLNITKYPLTTPIHKMSTTKLTKMLNTHLRKNQKRIMIVANPHSDQEIGYINTEKKNTVNKEEDSPADTYSDQDPQTTSQNNQSKHKFISIAQGIRNMFDKPPAPDTELNLSNIHSQSCTKYLNKSQTNQLDPHPKPDSVNGEKSKTYNPLNSKSDDHPPDNSMNKEKPLENPEKDPSTAMPKELSIYIFDQRIKLMKRINTINNKSVKLDSLIINENYKLKEISKELDLLKHNWKNSPKKEIT